LRIESINVKTVLKNQGKRVFGNRNHRSSMQAAKSDPKM